MTKQLIKLTESDLHKIIENAVKKIALSEGWKDSYDKWRDHVSKGGDNDEGQKLNKKWSDELKSEYPDKSKRRNAFNQHSKSKDTSASKEFEKKWKSTGGEDKFKKDYAKKYGVEIKDDAVDEAIKKTINKILKESEDFTPNGYKTTSNFGGKEIQINRSGDAARFRDNYGDGPNEPTDWFEIQFDEEGVAYVETPNGTERLDQFMRY